MTMPWFRPSEDARATRPEKLVSAGSGRPAAPAGRPGVVTESGTGRRIPAPGRAPFGAVVAVGIGVVAPLALALWVLYRLRAPALVWVLVGAAIAAPIAVRTARTRAVRRRAEERRRAQAESAERT